MPVSIFSRPRPLGSARPAAMIALLVLSGSVFGQSTATRATPVDVDIPSWVALEMLEDDADAVQRYKALQGRQVRLEKELRKLRSTYFRTGNTEMRQIGISKLRKYTDPGVYPLLLEVFEKDSLDVRTAILDMLVDQQTDDADTTLAWSAVFDRDEAYREAALDRLEQRIEEAGEVPDRITYIVAQGLAKQNHDEAAAAARVANNLNIVKLIPNLINAQVGGTGASGERQGALGWIMVGRQIAFVSDLQPVVADSAVAFDPQLSVITDGVVIRAIDAVVVTYRTEVHGSLLGLAQRASGEDLGSLGWDQRAWWDWYRREMEPELARRRAEGLPMIPSTPTDPEEGG